MYNKHKYRSVALLFCIHNYPIIFVFRPPPPDLHTERYHIEVKKTCFDESECVDTATVLTNTESDEETSCRMHLLGQGILGLGSFQDVDVDALAHLLHSIFH